MNDPNLQAISLIYKSSANRLMIPFRYYSIREVAQLNKQYIFETPLGFRLNYYNTVSMEADFINWLVSTLKKVIVCDEFIWNASLVFVNDYLKQHLKYPFHKEP